MIAIPVVTVAVLVVCVGGAMRGVALGARRTVSGPPAVVATPPRGSTRGAKIAAPAIGVALGVAIVSPVLVSVVAAMAVTVRRARPIVAAQRRRRDAERALPDALDLLVLSIRAGLTPQQAVGELAVHAPEAVREAFASSVHRASRGQSFADSLAALPETLGPRAAGLADVIATTDRYGLPLGPVLDQLTTEARDARRRLEQAEARKLPVRLSFPLVVCTLPSFVLLAIAPAVIAALSSLGESTW